MDPSDVTFGTEARRHIARYMVREDALRYALANAAFEDPDHADPDVTVVFGHDPDGMRYRFSVKSAKKSHVLTFRRN